MSTFNWLRRLTKCESGNVLFIGAATLPMMMGAAGLSIDTVQLALWKRQLQRAADSAAIAGAHAIVQRAATDQAVANDLDEHVTFDPADRSQPLIVGSAVTAGSYAARTMSNQTCTARAITPCYDVALQVELASERRLPFMNIFTGKPNRVETSGTAAVTVGGDFCMIALHNGATPGVIAGGNATLDLSCGIATNARAATNAINIYGDANVTATPLSAVGGIAPGKNSYSAQVLQPYSTKVADPYAGIPNPAAPSTCGALLDVANGETRPLPTNSCFTSWDVKGTVQLADNGVYYVNNGTLDIKGSVIGNNVTIILLGDDSNLVQNGGGTLNISAPETGPYKGIALYRSRTAANDANKPVKITGGAELQLRGAIYMPSTDIWIGGNTAFDATCLQVVGRTIEFKGGGRIRNTQSCSGTNSAPRSIIRLVG
jgi:Flp pilus assembly protein TadG